MIVGSLFSGIGGFELAADMMGWETAFTCEINPFCQQVLKHHWPNATSYEDITKTDFTVWGGRIDVLCGGFPCQEASSAKQDGGRQSGLQGFKTGLYWQMLRAIQEIRPRFVVCENVSAIIRINGGADFYQILKSLHEIGYDAEWDCFYAANEGAPHLRERVYLVAYAKSIRQEPSKYVLIHVGEAVEANPRTRMFNGAFVSVGGAWAGEPPMVSLDDGIPPKSYQGYYDTIQAAGNAIVPHCALRIFRAIDKFNQSL